MSTVTANKLKIKDILERNDKLVRSVFSTETVIVVVDADKAHVHGGEYLLHQLAGLDKMAS